MNLSEKDLKDIERYKSGFRSFNIVDAATIANGGVKLLSQVEEREAYRLGENCEDSICKFVPASGAATRMMHGDTSLPKALVPFHKYEDFERTAIEEHFVEGAAYVKEHDDIVNLHFTVSEAHLKRVEEFCNSIKACYQERYKCKYNLSFSVQDPNTAIIAVDDSYNPVITEDGNYLRRPGGHGALIKNLSSLDYDYIFIKNIDNVVKEEYLDETIYWKRVLLGRAIYLRTKMQDIINKITDSLAYTSCGDKHLIDNEIAYSFLEREFSVKSPSVEPKSIKSLDTKELLSKLNRPIRVCGVVKNMGEVGGGPFICLDDDGYTSLQIVELSQIDKGNPKSLNALGNSTHFNPVDIVCSIKNSSQSRFNLEEYVDSSYGLITEKEYMGRKIKAQELPGLWNGSMYNWNTQFVEVPISTFNPVKTYEDLKRPMHQ